MTDQVVFPAAAVPAIIGLVHVARNIGLPDAYSPLLAVALGVAASVAQALTDGSPIVPAVIYGTILGLSACGLYATTKSKRPKDNVAPPLVGGDKGEN